MVVDDLGGAVRNQQRGVRVVSLKIHLGCDFFAGGSLLSIFNKETSMTIE